MGGATVFLLPFHGDTLYLAEMNGELWLPVRPLLLTMGLRPDVQYRKLTGHFASGLCTMRLTLDGEPEVLLCLHVRKLSGWLMSLKMESVSNRETVMRYRHELDDAVYAFWHETVATRPDIPAELPHLPAPDDRLLASGHDNAGDGAGHAMAEFWFLYELLLVSTKPRLNHSTDPALIAVDPFEFRQYCERRKLKFPDIDRLRRELHSHSCYAYAGFKVIRSPHTGKYRQCWLFRPAPPSP